MLGNDVRHVVACRASYGATTGIQCLQLCPIHDNTRGACVLGQDCMQIPMQPPRGPSAAGRIVGSKAGLLIGRAAKIVPTLGAC